MKVGSLTSAARTALSGIDAAADKVEEVARNVAGGSESRPGAKTADVMSALSRLPELKQHARANAEVLDTADTLLKELAAVPRR